MSERLSAPAAEVEQFGSCWVVTDGSLSPTDALKVFGQDVNQADMIRVGRGGRGSAWQLLVNDEPAVLRRYRRGGMMAKVNRDHYLWLGLELTRAFKEFRLMLRLAEAGHRVPRPVSAMVKRSGIFYRAAILTRFIEHRGALCDCDSEVAWRAAGTSVARLHQAGVWHADLNVHNILIDAHDQAWLIDFDRAREGVADPQKLQENLSRLLRSVRKTCPDLEQRLWPVLLGGYGRI
ncbi:3-deoxy-D-manno-octulosonic acid kinase [Orrella daihaiensis]|uniref:3-deoxy-D-manno-octulosonic acid kinase n=1 Tax=Orrella daihaiensis TaxID=2782176 RepID=A0ABY4AR00_9BURK|nr:3-deoxy-D-manno-octulosonic acid kinase [Orrella daihaiensis]UOD51475.1 3-deoxy-D-manno-octulosonic acid kinase [Orrella daihaiensis]